MMKHVVLLFGIVIGLLAVGAFAEEEESFVEELTVEEFDAKIENDIWFIKFSAPTCGFCKIHKPTWEKTAKAAFVQGHETLHIANFNVRQDDARSISQRYKIGKLPGYRLFRDGQVFELPNSRVTRTVEEYLDYALRTYMEVYEAEIKAAEEEAARQAEIDAKSAVVTISSDNWDDIKNDGKVYFLDFYGSSCGHCKKLAPTWEELAFHVRDNEVPIVIAKVLANGEPMTRAFQANPWPALKLYREGVYYDFPNPRDVRENLQEYIDFALEGYKALEGTTPDEIRENTYVPPRDEDKPSNCIDLPEDEADFDAATAEGNWLIDFYAPSCGFCKMMSNTWETLADEVVEQGLDLKIAKFNVREGHEISKRMKIGKLPGVILIRSGRVYTFPNPRVTKSIKGYIKYAMEDYQKIEDEEIARVEQERLELEAMEAASDVYKFSNDDFEEDKHDQPGEAWFIEFYGPKCGHCKMFQPIWEALATYVKENNIPLKIGKADSKENGAATRVLKANPWPALKLVVGGKYYTYPTPREHEGVTSQDFVDWALEGYKATEAGELKKVIKTYIHNEEDAKYVKELTVEDFENGLVDKGVWYIDFYAPSCGFCKMFEPEWRAVARKAHERNLDITVAKFNVREDKSISKKYKVGKLPTVVLLVDGEMYPLPDPRKTRSVTEYIRFATTDYEAVIQVHKDRLAAEEDAKNARESSSDVLKLAWDDFESEMYKDGNFWFIEFYGEKCGYCKNLIPMYEELATYVKENNIANIKIAKAISRDVTTYARMFKASPWPALKLYREGKVYDFPEPRTVRETAKEYVDFILEGYKEVEGWELDEENTNHRKPKPANIDELADPSVELTPEHFTNGTLDSGIWFIDFYAPSCGFCKMIANDWKHLALRVEEDNLGFNMAKFNVRESREISRKYKIGSLPQFILIRDGKTYTFPSSRASRSHRQYIDYVLEDYDKVEREEQAKKDKEAADLAAMEAVSNVVKLTDESMEFDKPVDEGIWFVDFYGPKCGFCKKMAPHLEKLADYVKEKGYDINIAKMDALEGSRWTRQAKANPWPALRLYRDGRIYDFPEPREIREDPQEYVDFCLEGYKAEGVTSREPVNMDGVRTFDQAVVYKPEDPDWKSDVIDLNAEALTDGTLEEGVWILMFGSEGCGFCKMFEKDLHYISNLAKKRKVDLKVAKIYLRKENNGKEIAKEWKVTKLPQVYLIRDGGVRYEMPDARNPRSFAWYVKWATKNYATVETGRVAKIEAERKKEADMDAASVIIDLTNEDFDVGGRADQGTWLIEFYGKQCGHCKKFRPKWEELGFYARDNEVTDVKIAKFLGNGSPIGHQMGANPWPAIMLWKNHRAYKFPNAREHRENVEEYLDFARNGYLADDVESKVPGFIERRAPQAPPALEETVSTPEPEVVEEEEEEVDPNAPKKVKRKKIKKKKKKKKEE